MFLLSPRWENGGQPAQEGYPPAQDPEEGEGEEGEEASRGQVLPVVLR